MILFCERTHTMNKGLSALADKTRIVPTKSKDKFVMKNVCFVFCIRIKIFKFAKLRQRLICSYDRPAWLLKDSTSNWQDLS